MTKLDDMTLGEIKQLMTMFGGSAQEHPYQIGKNYFIRTVTFNYTGRLVKVTQQELVLDNAAWIADTGVQLATMINEGTKDSTEIEPYPSNQEIIIGRGAVVDASEWKHDLPRRQQ